MAWYNPVDWAKEGYKKAEGVWNDVTGQTAAKEMSKSANQAAEQSRGLGRELMNYGQLGAQTMMGMGQAEGNKMLGMGQQAGQQYASQWDPYGQQLNRLYGEGGSMSGPSYSAQRYTQSLSGNDPYYNRMSQQGMNQLAQQAVARGGLRSGATGAMQGNYLSGLGAERFRQMDALAGQADTSEQARIGQMLGGYGQMAGGRMSGLQAGTGQGIAGYGQMAGQGMQGWGSLYGAGMGAYGQQVGQGINAQMQAGMYGPMARQNFWNNATQGVIGMGTAAIGAGY